MFTVRSILMRLKPFQRPGRRVACGRCGGEFELPAAAGARAARCPVCGMLAREDEQDDRKAAAMATPSWLADRWK